MGGYGGMGLSPPNVMDMGDGGDGFCRISGVGPPPLSERMFLKTVLIEYAPKWGEAT